MRLISRRVPNVRGNVLTSILILVTLLSIFLCLWQWMVAIRFPLHQEKMSREFPTVSILKPLKGTDEHTEDCLRSWFTQEYPGSIQLLFGVASSDDPVCVLVRRLMAEYPAQEAELVICDPVLGANAKVSTLVHLYKKSGHELIVISDADVLVEGGFLKSFVAEFDCDRVGLANCFYQLSHPVNVAMRLEAMAVNADFWPQVLQGISLKRMDFALGAVMGMRKKAISGIGGFESLLDYLADDYQLGNRVAANGWKVTLSPLVVQSAAHAMSAKEVWEHQLRWARTIRFCQPVPYFLSVLNNVTFWSTLAVLLKPVPLTFGLWIAAAGLRCVSAWHCQAKLERQTPARSFVLPLLKDLFQLATWAMAFLGNSVIWRGTKFKVLSGGKLIRYSNP
ncbi:MAG: bacteriohopanetetrol glucosamine biosynthesis glycosyltransferase HpnI [Verrucomicrobiota bacterium]|nr:bacteriohopanetetrol glucosamine biosynthesis glycosyltransferase HpnI [Verrucomicrobiota bacterium]